MNFDVEHFFFSLCLKLLNFATGICFMCVKDPFTAAEAENPDFAHLIRKSGNAYTFAADGYDPYFSANISITKEIGDHVSLSFNAINFTNSRAYVKSYATGTSAIFTPNFYYGLTCRIKL